MKDFSAIDTLKRDSRKRAARRASCPVSLHQIDGPRAADPARRRRRRGRDGIGLRIADLLVVDARRGQAVVHGQGPGDVVVGLVRRFRRELLRHQQVHRVVAVRLIELHDVVALREAPFLDRNRLREPGHLDPVAAEDIDHLGDAQPVALILGNHEGVRIALHALLPGVVSLPVEIPQHLLRVLRGPVEDGETAALHVVRVVAQRPEELLVGRPRPVPLPVRDGLVDVALLGRAERALDGLRRGVAEGLVAAADRVVVRGDRVEVVQSPRLAESPGPDARHAEGRERLDLVERGLEPLPDRDRVQVRVVRARAVPDVEERDRLVQIVHGLRVVVVKHPVHGLGQLQRLLMRVAVVVVEDVVPPVGRRPLRKVVVVGLALQVPVEPVDGLVPAVRLGDRVDQDDQVLADVLDHRLLRDGQPVRQLHDHLGAAGLGRVQAGVEVVDRPRRRDDLLGGLGRRFPRVGEVRGRGLQAVEALDPFLVRDGDEQDLAALLGLADDVDLDAGRGLGQRAEVTVDLARARELPGRAHDVAEELRRRRHGRGGGHVGDPRAREPRLRRELRDRFDRAGLGDVGRDILRGRGDSAEKDRRDASETTQRNTHPASSFNARGPEPRNRITRNARNLAGCRRR